MTREVSSGMPEQSIPPWAQGRSKQFCEVTVVKQGRIRLITCAIGAILIGSNQPELVCVR
eukprot:4232435-Amphidinium_carterae.1